MLLWLPALAVACGDDAVFFFSVRFGTVASDADCHAGGGSFSMRETGGFTVLVILTDDTDIILVNVGGGTCGDVRRDSAVEVRGREDGDGTIRATTVRLG